jgi:hypothetical protein
MRQINYKMRNQKKHKLLERRLLKLTMSGILSTFKMALIDIN